MSTATLILLIAFGAMMVFHLRGHAGRGHGGSPGHGGHGGCGGEHSHNGQDDVETSPAPPAEESSTPTATADSDHGGHHAHV